RPPDDMNAIFRAPLVFVLFPHVILAAVHEAPPPIAPAYDANRQLLPTDFVRFDWHDDKRNCDVPVKVYFPTGEAKPLPVIVFSHGLGGTREGYEYLG